MTFIAAVAVAAAAVAFQPVLPSAVLFWRFKKPKARNPEILEDSWELRDHFLIVVTSQIRAR